MSSSIASDSRPARRGIPLPLLALALAAFAIGTSEFVIVGLLPEVARDTGVSLSQAGLLVTGYALGVAFGAPPLAALTARSTPLRALSALMLLYIAGNVMCALAPSYGWMMAGRIVASLTHGAFFGLGATVAAALVEPQHRSAAIALMFSGLTLANVMGVPAGAWIGQLAGWRATFWAVSAVGVLALVGILALVPRSLPRPGHSAEAGWRILRRPRLLGALALTALGFGGIFTTLTYLSPLLQTHAQFSATQVNGLLLLFGLGLTVGNVLGGWAADRWPGRSMLVILGVLAAVEVALYFFIEVPSAVVVAVFLWGLAAFATAPGLQSRVLDEAGDAPTLASTLNIAAFNLGNAIAAWIGAQGLDAGLPLTSLPLVSAALAVVAVVLLAAMGSRHRPTAPGA